MPEPASQPPDQSLVQESVRDLLGYFNFSSGAPTPNIYKSWNQVFDSTNSSIIEIEQLMLRSLESLEKSSSAFKNADRARRVIPLVFQHLLPKYRGYHADLLGHLQSSQFEHPFFIARLAECLLKSVDSFQDDDELIEQAILDANTFLGYRPIAVLENGRQIQPYAHERFALIPLYVRDVGCAVGKYQDLLQRTLELLKQVPDSVISATHFHENHLEELALDVRAYDYNHPVYKRTNYLFGEWDPHDIGLDGFYHRFVVRSVILDALIDWIDRCTQVDNVPYEESLFDAAAALSGTILMASSISGAGPDTFASEISLSSLLPIVARQRDFFYDHLMSSVSGERAARLAQHFEATQQPFGHVRHALNLYLSSYGARQVRNRELALMYARMGYAEESRRTAAEIPAASLRFETEIQWRIRIARQHSEQGEFDEAGNILTEIRELIHRAIESGALLDPWNILGFQGQFPLFSNREDSVPDVRVESLIDLLEQIFSLYASTLSEAAMRGRGDVIEQMSIPFKELAETWDRYATTTVEDIPKLYGMSTYESSRVVARTLLAWETAGPDAQSLAFWREHVDMFDSHLTYHNIVSVLLDKQDLNASLGLLMQWLSQVDETESVQFDETFSVSLLEWAQMLRKSDNSDEEMFQRYRRVIDLLDANAGKRWGVPRLTLENESTNQMEDNQDWWDEPAMEGDWANEEEDDEANPFSAAYEGVTFRDSADDGQEGMVSDSGYSSEDNEFEKWGRTYEPQLKFLQSVAETCQQTIIVAARLMNQPEANPESSSDPVQNTSPDNVVEPHIHRIIQDLQRFERELGQLLHEIHIKQLAPPTGSHDANIEYDIQLQSKLYLMHSVIWTLTRMRFVRRLAESLFFEPQKKQASKDRWLTELLQAILQQNTEEIQARLPKALLRLGRRKLLYVPLENGGTPRSIADAQELHALLRFLVTALPALGLYRQTWQVMVTAYEMERGSRPRGPAITEFDRLFRLALSNTLTNLLKSARHWRSGKLDDQELIEILSEVVEHYRELWMRHSETMRLSAAEVLNNSRTWESIRAFIHKYGHDLFHARNLTLGYVRSIVQNGLEEFLDYLDENDDPIQPSMLIDDLRAERVEPADVAQLMETIYGILIDKFDRFLEYNSTTTHSDYGERFDCFLDFARLEARYDRDDWDCMPHKIAHEALIELGRLEAAEQWERIFAHRTSRQADDHVKQILELEQTYGVRLPALQDRILERFVKPLAVNRMLALIRQVMEADEPEIRRARFDDLRVQIEQYQDGTSGTGLEIPDWLRILDQELRQYEAPEQMTNDPHGEQMIVPVTINLRDMKRQLKTWQDDVMPNPRKHSKRPHDKS